MLPPYLYPHWLLLPGVLANALSIADFARGWPGVSQFYLFSQEIQGLALRVEKVYLRHIKNMLSKVGHDEQLMAIFFEFVRRHLEV